MPQVQERLEKNPYLYVDFSQIATSGSTPYIDTLRRNDVCGWDDDTPCAVYACTPNIISDATGQFTEYRPIEKLLRTSSEVAKLVREVIPIDEHDQNLVDNIVDKEHQKAQKRPFPK